MKGFFKILGIRSDFEKIFFRNEYDVLIGKRKQVLTTLILILLVTFLALGYALGTIKNLEKKTSDPFTNWLSVDKNTSMEIIMEEINNRYQLDSVKSRFYLEDLTYWNRYFLDFAPADFNPAVNSGETIKRKKTFAGLTIEVGNPLIHKVLKEENVVWKAQNLDSIAQNGLNNCEIIITEDRLEVLGVEMSNLEDGCLFIITESTSIPIKVIAVVKELPRKCRFLSSQELYYILNNKMINGEKCYDFISQNENLDGGNIFNFIIEEKTGKEELIEIINSNFFSDRINEKNCEVFAEKLLYNGKTWLSCKTVFVGDYYPSYKEIDAFVLQANQSGFGINHFNVLDCTSEDCEEISFNKAHYLAFHFKDPRNIRDFQQDMKEHFDVEVDMEQIETKENFALVSQLTKVISIILLAFSILSIVLFLNNLLKTHLMKVKPNLGTLKAFGSDDEFLNKIYLKIIISFLLKAIFYAYVVVSIIDLVENLIYKEESSFDVFNIWLMLAIVGLVVFSSIMSSKTIKRILGDTPGNLIYER